jgi:hypothetical protein
MASRLVVAIIARMKRCVQLLVKRHAHCNYGGLGQRVMGLESEWV